MSPASSPASLPGLPEGAVARPASMQDVEAVTEVIRTSELDHGMEATTTFADVDGDFRRPSVDLDRDTRIVEVDGSPVAYGEQFGGRAFVHVLPTHRGRGIGTALASWTEDNARAAGLDRVGQTLHSGATAGRALLASRGYRSLWDSWVLRRPLHDLPVVRLPDGVALRDMRRPDDDRRVYDTIEVAFDTWPDRDASHDFEDWEVAWLDRAWTTGLVVLAEQGDDCIGVAVCSVEDGVGWIDQLAVHPDHWGRGVAGALLASTFARFAERGIDEAALSTDSRTGALGLYEHVGMHVTETFARLSLDLA